MQKVKETLELVFYTNLTKFAMHNHSREVGMSTFCLQSPVSKITTTNAVTYFGV